MRDVEDAFWDATVELLISKSAVSEITDSLWKDYEPLRVARPLSDRRRGAVLGRESSESLRAQVAIEAVFPRSARIRAWFHRLANIFSKLPDDEAGDVMAHRSAVRDAPSLHAARVAADRFSHTYRDPFPATAACFEDDREALLAIHRLPCGTASGGGPPTSPKRSFLFRGGRP